MSNLIKFILGSRTPVLIDPRFIREVHGNAISTDITIASLDADTNDYRVHTVPKSIQEVTQMIEDKFAEIKSDLILEQGNQD